MNNNFQIPNHQNSQSNTNFQQANANPQDQQNQQNNQQQPSWLMQIAGAVLPTLLEQFTGQKMTPSNSPPSTNAMETQLMLTQVLTQQQLIINSQQDLTNRIVNLETRASQQFNGLVKQVQNLSSVRLTSERERKQIDFNQNSDHYGN